MRFSVGFSLPFLFATAGLAAPTAVAAQAPAPATATTAWIVQRDAFADLWYHSLAIVGYEGYGPLHLYDSGYAARVRDAKARIHIATTLDQRAPELRKQLSADSAFEVLHFLPLYFVGQEPTLVLAALRDAIRGTPSSSRGRPLTSAANLVAATLASGQERAVFASLLDAMSDEWTTFLRADRASRMDDDRRVVHNLQTAWDSRFARSLDGYLSAMGAHRGTILISPALGTDGRILRAPSGAVIVAVSGTPALSRDDAALLRAVRELGFPLLDRLHTPLGSGASRVASARARDVAAVRAGAIILDVVDGALAADYRRLFLDAIGGRAFNSAYPLSSEAEAELHRLVTSAADGAVSGRTSYEKE